MKNTVADLIEYLKKLPPRTPVKVLQEHTIGFSTTTRWVDLDVGDGVSSTSTVMFIDERWTNNSLLLGDN